MDLETIKDSNGELPAYAWPGGYPLYYVDAMGCELCPQCANKEEVSEDEEPVAYDANWENPHLFCEDCGERIESAYADDEEE